MKATNSLADRRQTRKLTRSQTDTQAIGWELSEIGGGHEHPFALSHDQRARHLYILGATGSGKTNLILQLLANDLAEGRSIAIVDLRGDLVDRLMSRLASSETAVPAERIALLDLRDSEKIVGFNPLAGKGEPHSRAYFVLDALRSHSESWGIQLEETLRNALIALAEAQLSLLELEPLLTSAEHRTAILGRSSDPSVGAFFERFSSLSPERQQTWVLPVLNKVTPLLGIPRLRLLFGCPKTIDFEETLNRPGSILMVSLAVDRFHSASRLIGSLVLGALEGAVMGRVDVPERARNPVNLYVDEFETMATEAFSSIVAEGRRFRLSLTLSHQNLSQIPPNLRQVIRNNIQTQIYFQTGAIDARELRHEITNLEREEVVKALQSLPIGHAYVCRRPAEPVLVRFEEALNNSVAASTVAEFRSRVHERMGCLSPAQVQGEIEERMQRALSFGLNHIETGSSLHHTRTPRRSRRRGA